MATVQSGFTPRMKDFLLEYLSDHSDLVIRILATNADLTDTLNAGFGNPQNGKVSHSLGSDRIFEVDPGTNVSEVRIYDQNRSVSDSYLSWDLDIPTMTHGGEFIIKDYSVEFD